MRDDRYRGTSLPRLVRKLCRMAEREADRGHPERLRQQAVAALLSDAEREISPEFRRRLREHDVLQRHRSEWDGFMSTLPEQSWVRQIVGQL